MASYLPSVEKSFSLKVQNKLLKKIKISHISNQKHKNIFIFKSGWNQQIAPKGGTDVIQTFKNTPEIKFVVTYDMKSKYWAGFTLDQSVLKDIKEMLFLRYLEEGVMFFVLSEGDLALKIKQTQINSKCSNLMSNKDYNVLYDTGLTTSEVKSEAYNISIRSRYSSHEYRGYYDDTRVVLIYPKLKVKSKDMLKYGPAEPMVMLHYAKEYQDKSYLVFDYLQKKCYKGVFPSNKMPPIPVLQELK